MTYTHLRVGTSKLYSKPPRAQPPCTEPYITGTNILRDPGFELHSANVSPGPDGENFPEVGSQIWHWEPFWTDDTAAIRPATGWVVFSNNDAASAERWKISTVNPRSGTYHARRTIPSVDDFIRWPEEFYVVGTRPCTIGGTASARVEPGDYVRLSCWAMCNVLTDAPQLDLDLQFWDEAGTQIVEPFTSALLTASYAQYSSDAFAPVGAFWLSAQLVFTRANYAPAVDTHFDVDDCVLEVS